MKRSLFAFVAVFLLSTPAHADLDLVVCRYGSAVVLCTQLHKGKTYVANAHGSWLDITSSVSAPSGLSTSIASKGGGPGNPYVNVRIQVGTTCPVGDKKIILTRPALGGTDSDNFLVTVID